MNVILQIVAAFIGTLGFAVLFNIRGVRLVVAALGGLLSWAIFLLFRAMNISEPLGYFLVAVIIMLYSEIMARVLKTPTTTFITTSLIPLIPGGSLYYTMTSAFSADTQDFLSKGFSTLKLASALALGIIVASALAKMIFKNKTVAQSEEMR